MSGECIKIYNFCDFSPIHIDLICGIYFSYYTIITVQTVSGIKKKKSFAQILKEHIIYFSYTKRIIKLETENIVIDNYTMSFRKCCRTRVLNMKHFLAFTILINANFLNFVNFAYFKYYNI